MTNWSKVRDHITKTAPTEEMQGVSNKLTLAPYPSNGSPCLAVCL